MNAIRPIRHLVVLTSLALVSGCAIFAGEKPAIVYTGEEQMMDADRVPLGERQRTVAPGDPVPVPVEPSPFETGAKRPAAMKSDLLPPPAPQEKSDKPRRIPREPIP